MQISSGVSSNTITIESQRLCEQTNNENLNENLCAYFADYLLGLWDV